MQLYVHDAYFVNAMLFFRFVIKVHISTEPERDVGCLNGLAHFREQRYAKHPLRHGGSFTILTVGAREVYYDPWVTLLPLDWLLGNESLSPVGNDAFGTVLNPTIDSLDPGIADRLTSLVLWF